VPTARRRTRSGAGGQIPPTGIPLEDIERHALVEALRCPNWVQKDAAELLSDQPARDELQDQDTRIEFPRAGGQARFL